LGANPCDCLETGTDTLPTKPLDNILTVLQNEHTFAIKIAMVHAMRAPTMTDYKHVPDGRSFLLSTGRWQTTVTDVKPFQSSLPPIDDVDEETLFHDWLFFQLKFTNEAHVELNLKLYVCVHLRDVEAYGQLDSRVHQEIELWLGNSDRGTELTIGPSGPIWPCSFPAI
jgi:hypothetical protein